MFVADNRSHHAARSNALRNPSHRLHTVTPSTAVDYVKQRCPDVGDVYSAATTARAMAHVFKYCALHSEGGVYVDDGLHVMRPLEDV